MKIFQGVPCSEASGGGGSVEQTSAPELRRGWTHCSSILHLCSECTVPTNLGCHWGNSERAENTKSAPFEKIEKILNGELGNFTPV